MLGCKQPPSQLFKPPQAGRQPWQQEGKLNLSVLLPPPLLLLRPCRGYNSPEDISMKMEQLLQDMPGIVLTPFEAALQQVFPRS